MIYEWRCSSCGEVVDITRPAADYDVPPDEACTCPGWLHDKAKWEKKISVPHYDMEHMFDKGIFERVERWPTRGM
jgi:hypothetical protein